MPEFRVGAELTSAHAGRLDRRGAQHPVRDVDVVDVLLDNVIAREPCEVQPVAQLPLGVGPRRLTVAVPQAALIPEHLARHDLADRAIFNPSDRRLVIRLMTALGADADAQALLQREFVRGEHRAHAGRVNCDRLLGKDVFSGFSRCRQMCRTEVGRCREDDKVHVSREHLLVGVEAREGHVVGDLVFRGQRRIARRGLGQLGATAGEAIGCEVTHGDELNAVRSTQTIQRRTRAAPTAANQAHANGVGPLSQSDQRNAPRERHRRRRCGRCLNEATSIDLSHFASPVTTRKPTKGPSDNHH